MARQMSKQLLKKCRLVRRWVSHKRLLRFCGVCVSLTLAMPWALFTRGHSIGMHLLLTVVSDGLGLAEVYGVG